MKKVLLLSLSLALGFSAFAQQRVAKNDVQSFKVNAKTVAVGNENVNPSYNFVAQPTQSVVINRQDDNEEIAETMVTNYDLQSNSWCSNRMYQLPNGDVGIVGTLSHEPNQTASDRGTGYNFYNAEAEEWGDQPEERIESMRTGWPTIAQWGEAGEIMISHTPCRCWTREKAGEGEWVYRGELPNFPEGYPYNEDAAWPRVATSGANHNIIHVIADLQHSGTVTEHHQVYLRSEDAENWTISYSPLAQDGEETGHYSADAYNISANGHNVAMIYADDLQSHVVMYKSTDDGLTWERTIIWENPYYGCDWATDECSVFTEPMYGPANVALAIDNNGVVHVAISAYEYVHDELGDSYTTYSGRAVDGIYYWNDTQEAPIQAEDGNPHNALRLWWPIPDDPDYVEMHADSTKWIGFLPMYEDEQGNLIQYDNDKFYRESDYFYKFRSGQSGMPALSIDPMGNIACAYSAPCTMRENDAQNNQYMRSIYVSYRNVDEGYWHQVVDDLNDDFMYSLSENIFTISVDNTTQPGEFWFGFQSDDLIGLYWGSNATQNEATDNGIVAVKILPEPEFVSVPENHDAINPMTAVRVYPNPATDVLNIEVNASQSSAMSINVFNIMGQKVMESNVNINTGMNTPAISTAELASGIYFVTVKANGFENTMKFIVK